MSESELREFVKYVQTMRQSAVTFKAEIVKREEKQAVVKRASEKVATFGDLLDE